MTIKAETGTLVVRLERGLMPKTLILAAVIALPLSGCSSVGNTLGGLFGGDTVVEEGTQETASQSSEAQQRFSAPASSGQGAPDLNTVPSETPTPSPQSERDQALEGLIADRSNTRHTPQGARSIPVAVRPLRPGEGQQTAENSEPPVPEAATVDPVTRLEDVPPPRPVEAGGEEDAQQDGTLSEPPTQPSVPTAGPRSSPTPLPSTSIASNSNTQVSSAAVPQFRPLTSFDASRFSISSEVASLPSVARGLSTADREVLEEATNMRANVRGVLRVIARAGSTPSDAMALAVRVAEALIALGVPSDSLFVGTDAGDGPVEVILDY